MHTYKNEYSQPATTVNSSIILVMLMILCIKAKNYRLFFIILYLCINSRHLLQRMCEWQLFNFIFNYKNLKFTIYTQKL